MKHQKLFHIRALIKGVNLKQLSEFEQARRSIIGIITENHLQKDLALKGITIEKFKLVNKNLLILHQNDQGQERSAITPKNQIDLFIDPVQMEEPMKYIISYYGFVVTFPLTEKLKKIIDSNYLRKTNFDIKIYQVANDFMVESCKYTL